MGLHPSLYWSRRLLLSSSPGTSLSPPLFYFSRSLSRSPPRSSFHSQIPTTVTVPVPHSFFFATPFLATLVCPSVSSPPRSALRCTSALPKQSQIGVAGVDGGRERWREGGGVVSPGPPPLIRDDRLRRCGSDPGGGSALTFFFPAFDQPQLEVSLFAASRGARWRRRQCGQPGVTMGSGGGNECPCLFLGNSKKAVVARKRKKKHGVQVIKWTLHVTSRLTNDTHQGLKLHQRAVPLLW